MTTQSSLRLFVKLIAIASICMGLAGYLGYARLGVVLERPLFVSPYFSSVLILCGVLLYPGRAPSRFARLGPMFAISAIVFTHIAPQHFDAWMNARIDSANFASALVLSGAFAALLLRRHTSTPRVMLGKDSISVALLGVASSTLISYALIENDILKNQQFALTAADTIATDIQNRLTQTEKLMTRLGERWSALDHLPSPAFIDQELFSYMRDFGFFQSFAVVDDTHSVAWEKNRDASSLGWIEGLVADRTLRDWLGHVNESGLTHVTQSEHILIDRKVGLAASPLSNPFMQGWFVIARLDLAGIMAEATSRDEDIGHFRVTHGSSTLYQSKGEPPAGASAVGELTIPVHHDFMLGLSYWYKKPHAKAGIEILPDFVLLVGLIFTFFLISSQGLAQVARQRAIQLNHRALHDPLTGLANRRLLEKRLKEACNSEEGGSPVSVAFFDLDGIKLINDSMGHHVVDELLVEVANRLRKDVPADCSVARLGGDEFVLVFRGVATQQVQEYAQRLILALSKPYVIAGSVLRVTASAGIATGDGEQEDPMQLVRDADLAMLRAKQEGRNTWRTYTADMSAQVAERLQLRNDLQTALDSGGLELHYQPIVDLDSGRIAGVEALVRWPLAEHGYIPPSRFIPLAESTGQIVPLTEWVMASACRDSIALRKLGLPSFPVVVNISPLYFRRAGFVQDICAVLREAGLAPEFLQIEITEGVLLDDEEAAIQKLTALRNVGIKTSIDDFGTGYSSLSYLKRLPIDKVKIDRSFIIDVARDPADAAIVQGIISMAHHLGLRVVAEGLETQAQLDFLKSNRCDEYQGYLFSRPLPFNQLVSSFNVKAES